MRVKMQYEEVNAKSMRVEEDSFVMGKVLFQFPLFG